jgi:hypothetical protein
MFNSQAFSASTTEPSTGGVATISTPKIASQIHGDNSGTIAGIVLGAVAAVAVIVAIAVWIRRRKQKEKMRCFSAQDTEKDPSCYELSIESTYKELPAEVLVAELATAKAPVELASKEVDVKW